MSGKVKCKLLKEIRRRIAEENDIPYVTHECRYQGDCAGTCPRCESELRYLERQLALRESLGKRVAVAALCAGMTFSIAGCAPLKQNVGETELSGAVSYVDSEPTPGPEIFVTTGEVAWPEETPDEDQPFPEGSDLLGDVAYAAPAEDHG